MYAKPDLHWQYQLLWATWNYRNLHSLQVKNGRASSEHNLEISHKCKQTLSMLWYYSTKYIGNSWPYRIFQKDLYSSYINKCPNSNMIMISFSRWVDRLWYVHSEKAVLKKMSYQAMNLHVENLKRNYIMFTRLFDGVYHKVYI